MENICYWDEVAKEQREREATPEERAEIDARRAEAPLRTKALAWESIKTERERRKSGGVLVDGKWFHTDADSRIQHMGLVMMGVNIPADLQWKTLDGTFVTMTKDLAGQVFLAVAALDQAAFACAEQHRIAMEASAEPGAYNHSGGWPAIYEG